jgi:hypothetical protein
LQAINMIIHRFIHSLWITANKSAPQGDFGACTGAIQNE